MKRLLPFLLPFLLGTKPALAQVEPLLHTNWCQTSPFNAYCPEGTLAGCVAVAMAQVMNYHRHPAHGEGRFSYIWNKQRLTADFANTWYRWDDMENPYPSAAQLIYHCGLSVCMDYSNSFSGSNEYYARSALTDYFGYSEDIQLRPRNLYEDEEWSRLLREDLDRGWPIIYSSGGHTFVVDGYDLEGRFHANMGYGTTTAHRYYTIDELGQRNTSTALVHIHPQRRTEAPQVVLYLQDATAVHYPIQSLLDLNFENGNTLRVNLSNDSSSTFPISSISYVKVY